MANNINLQELRAQRAGRSTKANEEVVEKFIETGEVRDEEVSDPRQQSFFKEQKNADVIETTAQENEPEKPVAKQSPAERFIQAQTQKDFYADDISDLSDMTEKELYELILEQRKNVVRRKDIKTSKTYSISLPCALMDLMDKMAANRFMHRSALVYLLIMKGAGIELDADVKKSLPRPIEA